jgi:hypothetical protein
MYVCMLLPASHPAPREDAAQTDGCSSDVRGLNDGGRCDTEKRLGGGGNSGGGEASAGDRRGDEGEGRGGAGRGDLCGMPASPVSQAYGCSGSSIPPSPTPVATPTYPLTYSPTHLLTHSSTPLPIHPPAHPTAAAFAMLDVCQPAYPTPTPNPFLAPAHSTASSIQPVFPPRPSHQPSPFLSPATPHTLCTAYTTPASACLLPPPWCSGLWTICPPPSSLAPARLQRAAVRLPPAGPLAALKGESRPPFFPPTPRPPDPHSRIFAHPFVPLVLKGAGVGGRSCILIARPPTSLPSDIHERARTPKATHTGSYAATQEKNSPLRIRAATKIAFCQIVYCDALISRCCCSSS